MSQLMSYAHAVSECFLQNSEGVMTSETRTVPGPVQTVVDAYLAAVDHTAPGLIEGFYLEGSVALGDFRPQGSDIDFVAVTDHPPSVPALDALAEVHRQIAAAYPRPTLDGIYVTWDQLACDPAQLDCGPSSHEGRFSPRAEAQRNPITWHTLARSGLVCRGPAIGDVAIWQDAAVLAMWTDGNLESYWRPLMNGLRRLLGRNGPAGFSEWACAWGVLGVSRLHYTLATGEITSKGEAGRYALEAFVPLYGSLWQTRGARLIDEALRIHYAEPRPSRYRLPLLRRRDLIAFLDAVITDGHRLYEAKRLG